MDKPKTIIVSSVFDATEECMWELIRKIDTLRYIAAPYAYFTPLGVGAAVWAQGITADFRLRIFGFIPLGIHHIYVAEFDPGKGKIRTNESNPAVPVWNHLIQITPLDGNKLRYTDEVEMEAGWKTRFIAAWSKSFYRHRQKRWRKLLARGG
jgi:ligand-binding SRPBCC domain-containing protein